MRNKRVDNRKALCYNNVVAVLKPQNNKCADVMELADMLVLETSSQECEFKSRRPHQRQAAAREIDGDSKNPNLITKRGSDLSL